MTGCWHEFLKKIFFGNCGEKRNKLNHKWNDWQKKIYFLWLGEERIPERMDCMPTKRFCVHESRDFPKWVWHRPFGHLAAEMKTSQPNSDGGYSNVNSTGRRAFLIQLQVFSYAVSMYRLMMRFFIGEEVSIRRKISWKQKIRTSQTKDMSFKLNISIHTPYICEQSLQTFKISIR